MTQSAAASTAPDESRVLRITRRFAAPVDTVFEAWTDPAHLSQWFGPRGMNAPRCEVDLKIGGDWLIHIVNAEGKAHIVGGAYREIARPSRLAFTWSWRTEGMSNRETLVEIDFRAAGDETEMHFVHSLFEDEGARDSHNGGWTSSFECLDDHLKGA